MKFIHVADIHAGYRQYGFVERETDFYQAASHVAKRAVELKVDGVIISGDLFDMPKPPAAAVREISALIRTLRKHDIPTYGIDGNHDSVGGAWLEVCGIAPLDKGPIELPGGIILAGIPYMRPAAFHAEMDKLVQSGQHIDILAIHQALGEFADFADQDITAVEIAGKLGRLGVRYVAMGDIHDYHETEVGGVRFVYPGATEVNALDETHDCSFSIVDITKDSIATSYEPIPIRLVHELYLKDENQINSLLEDIDRTDESPLVIIWYEPEAKPLATRAESVLKSKHIMHLVRPLAARARGTLAEKMAKQSFERKGAMQQLNGAVETFFEQKSDRYELVFQMLNSPGTVPDIVNKYFESKDVQLETAVN